MLERTPADAVRGIANMVQTRSGTDLAAVSAKFGVRNPSRGTIYNRRIEKHISCNFYGSLLSGSLNFPRRTISAYFNSAVTPVFTVFKKKC